MAQEWSLTGPVPQSPPRGRGAIVSGIVLLVVGGVFVVAGIIGFAVTASGLVSGLGSPRTTPATFAQTFDAGTTYAVYERATSGSGTTGDPYLGNVEPGDVTVTAPDGTSVLVTASPGFAQTLSGSSGTYVVVATFDPPVTATYQVAISTEGSTVVVAPSLTAIARTLPWIAVGGLGVLLGLVGIVVLIVGVVRRSSSRQPAVAVAGQGAPYAAPGYAGPGYAAPGYAAPGYPTPTEGAPPTGSAAPAEGAPATDQPAPAQGAPATGHPAPAQGAPPTGYPAPTPALPPRGWYPDPERPGGQRYWDGAGWTEHRA